MKQNTKSLTAEAVTLAALIVEAGKLDASPLVRELLAEGRHLLAADPLSAETVEAFKQKVADVKAFVEPPVGRELAMARDLEAMTPARWREWKQLVHGKWN
jgi:hypothetical protein